MVEGRVVRKVTVILATDVVGYSNKLEQHEDQTLEILRACRAIIEGLIAEHHGRVFNTTGDSVLAEFPRAVEAVLRTEKFRKNGTWQAGSPAAVAPRNDRLRTPVGKAA